MGTVLKGYIVGESEGCVVCRDWGGATRFRYESLFCRNRDRENREYRNFRFFNLKFRILANFGKIGNNFLEFSIIYSKSATVMKLHMP